MEYPPNVLAGIAQDIDSGDSFAPLPDEWRLAQAAYEEWRHLGTPRVNVLLMGTNSVTCMIVGMLLRARREPVSIWKRGEELRLPMVRGCVTMVLTDVGAMPLEHQLQLLEWLEQPANRTHVISTASEPLLPLVHSGAFNETLLYRLNTICLDVNA